MREKRTRINLAVTEADSARLKRLAARIEAESHTETIRRALIAFEGMLDADPRELVAFVLTPDGRSTAATVSDPPPASQGAEAAS